MTKTNKIQPINCKYVEIPVRILNNSKVYCNSINSKEVCKETGIQCEIYSNLNKQEIKVYKQGLETKVVE